MTLLQRGDSVRTEEHLHAKELFLHGSPRNQNDSIKAGTRPAFMNGRIS
jgi:hypothetical protein